MLTKKDKVSSGKDTKPEVFDYEDDVRYEDFIEDRLPEEIIFPEELNRFLRDRIRDLSAENGCLRRGLEETEEIVRSLQKSQVSPLAAGQASELATTTIVELSRRCREMTAEVEVLKTKCKNFEGKLASKDAEIMSAKFSEKENSRKSANSSDGTSGITLEILLSDKMEEIRILNDKLQQVNSKLYESKNTCTSLRQEINKAQRLLCSEVGENVTIAGLSSHHSGWKGRSELIQQLQQKLSETQNRLNELDGTSKNSIASMESRGTANLRNIEKERRQQIENSAKELRQANVALEASKRKQEAAKARIKVLENEMSNAKRSIALLNEKRTHDDQLIQVLNGQLKAVEVKFLNREMEMRNLHDKTEHECIRITNELNRLTIVKDQLQRKLEERETEIDSLRSCDRPTTQICSLSPHEKNHDSPLATSRTDPNEYVTLGIAAEAERERLLELVTVLNRRLDKERCETDQLSERLRSERNKSARLETKLQRLELEKAGMSKINTGYKTRSSKSITAVSTIGDHATDQYGFKLELLKEECLALKTRLATTQQDRAADLTLYKQLLHQARKTFQDAYRGKLSSSGRHSTVTI